MIALSLSFQPPIALLPSSKTRLRSIGGSLIALPSLSQYPIALSPYPKNSDRLWQVASRHHAPQYFSLLFDNRLN
ncbi:hypothetical protein FRE64_12840 [Euhalothece natronophila Z-M001]|uniref:Uncharacterized protein n=1 Tax=Euhalothece natronophila Z-M001 TaxID=522448 RepID=A0A5B8NN53_9CHRO|nr:hypothetical protein [Euhalothece natronophila]QDZ40753.1 hypothetical protein FRE64_12840 [Euhalothece natronophila Z-M001]